MLGIEQYFSKIAVYCGFKVEGEKGYDPQEELARKLDVDTKGAKPLSNELLYEYCDDESGVFFNKGSIGCWFEIDPLVGSNDSIEKNLTLFFSDELPDGGYIQFLIVASHDIEGILHRWEAGRTSSNEALKKLTYYRKNFIRNLAADFAASGDGRLPRNFKTFLTYSIKDGGDKFVEELLKFKKKLESKLKAENLNPRVCKAGDLIEIGREILQMELNKDSDSNTKNKTKYNLLNSLSDQIVSPFKSNTITEETIEHNDTGLVSKVFAPRELPQSFCLAEMINLLGDERRTIPGRFVISYTVANNLGASGKSALETAGNRVVHAASRSYTKNDLVAQEEARGWVEVKALVKKGESYLQESMLVMLTTYKEEMEIAQEVLKSLYNTNDWKMEVCKRVQRIASLSMLPMMQCSYWNTMKFFRLTRFALSGEVVAKLPIQGEWKGVPLSGALLLGRRGQLFNFNPYFRVGGGGNYNISMMAPPGSGKSFFLEELAQSMLAQDVAVFILDIGASYKNICQAQGGEMIRFNQDCSISLNPFSGLSGSGARYAKALELLKSSKEITLEEIANITGLDIEKIEALDFGRKNNTNEAKELDGIELLEINSTAADGREEKHFVTKDSVIYAKSMLAAMCGISGQARGEALIERAIIEAVGKYGQDLDISKIAKILGNLKDNEGKSVDGVKGMADSLYPYTVYGTNGRFFKSGGEASFRNNLTVFELEELKNDEPLLAVILQIILMQITMQFLCGDRSKRFMLIVDEAWLILDFAASFLERFARTVRKYGGSLVVCTQDLTSFSNKCGTRKAQAAVLECSTWKLMLQQNADGMNAFANSEAYSKYVPLISSLRKCAQNKFSEVLIMTDGATVVGRLATDPYSTAMFSTENSDFAFLLQKEREGVSKHEAILELSKKYGRLPEIEQKQSENLR